MRNFITIVFTIELAIKTYIRIMLKSDLIVKNPYCSSRGLKCNS